MKAWRQVAKPHDDVLNGTLKSKALTRSIVSKEYPGGR